MVIRNPGKDDYTQLKAFRSVSLHNCTGKVVEKVTTELASEDVERWWLLSDGQFGNRNGRYTIDAAAIIVHTTHAALTNGHIPGMLHMDIKAAFLSLVKGRLVILMKVSQMDGD
jgi:hypothetical protein